MSVVVAAANSENCGLYSSESCAQDHHRSSSHQQQPQQPPLSRYESQKRRDWNTFGQYLRNHRPPLALARCSGAHVLEFLRYLDQFGKTKVHTPPCPFFGHPHPPAPCPCPLRQAWGSLDALVGRLRAAFEENGGSPEANPFGARAVRLYLREIRDSQAKARGISYEKKKRKRPPTLSQPRPPPQHGAGHTLAAVAAAGVANLHVEDHNSANGSFLIHGHHFHHHLHDHHGHMIISSDGSMGGDGAVKGSS
ncbi:unnamed protein product [Spirodela intermedia]|uniref:ALOG domain-containing protein n=1 Tax=Spirodela intermedia TaxID=51605 RepID=A0A7I8JNS1_SPIIN|nr:unnamed protein product [Spirodela intermedia]CAA6671824.1 unnamed protein product [Spirodela intermedia]